MENYIGGAGLGSGLGYYNYAGQTQTGIIGDVNQMNQNPAVKSPSIVEQLNHQEKAVDGLHMMVDQLVDRLAIILGPVPTAASQVGAAPQPTVSQISQRIPMHTRRIEAVGHRIAEIIARVEL